MGDYSPSFIFAGGVYHIAFAIFHLMFWKIFQWKRDLARLTMINRQVMQILNLCLTLVFLIMAYISLFHSGELLSTSLGKTMLFAITLFWFLRMIEQIIFFGLKTTKSIVFTLIFLLGTVIYLIPALN